MITKTVLALALCFLGCSSSEDEGCSNDSDCKGDRICESGKCVSPSGGSGGSGGGGGTGGTGGAVTTGGAAGCPSYCKSPAGTCCKGPGVCAAVPPCQGNECCSD